jgi:hypothetical protein
MEDPELFEWPLEDPLLCVAIAFMRKYANRWTDKVRERLSLTDDDDEPTDWWKGSGSLEPLLTLYLASEANVISLVEV